MKKLTFCILLLGLLSTTILAFLIWEPTGSNCIHCEDDPFNTYVLGPFTRAPGPVPDPNAGCAAGTRRIWYKQVDAYHCFNGNYYKCTFVNPGDCVDESQWINEPGCPGESCGQAEPK